MDNSAINKPCLVNTPQGFSISYKDKLLYSKYNPERAILQTIQNLTILPGTVFLCCSPVLEYGLKELLNKLPEQCILLRCEFDQELYKYESQNNSLNNIPLLTQGELFQLPVILNQNNYILECGYKLPPAYTFRRAIRIDFSAGSAFHNDLYSQLAQACTTSIMNYWSNRVTLTKFGRNYSKNLFKNLKILDKTLPLNNYIGKIAKPIIVCGAGESLNNGINDFIKNRDNFFILCADTALQVLQARKITPDGVFIEEAQQIITKAFTTDRNIHLFASLSSINQLSHNFDLSNISFFTTQYTDAIFLKKLSENNILPEMNQPFGSVGITAVYYALKFRASNEVPVYVYGLDFSYSAGTTHAKNTMAHRDRLLQNYKLRSVENYDASFNPNSIQITDKSKRTFYTMPVMHKYSQIFNSFFAGTMNLFDAAECGIKLEIPFNKPAADSMNNTQNCSTVGFSKDYISSLHEYLISEQHELKRLRNILTGEIKLNEEAMEQEIKKIATNREYLFLHFPDGWQFQYNQSFLNRIRTEIDFFLKIFD